MTTQTLTITSDGSEVLIQKYYKHNTDIIGMIEVGGSFGGGTLSFLISLSSGNVINSWKDITDQQYILTSANTVSFHIPATNPNASDIRIYYTLTGSTSPNISLTVADNQ